MTSIEFESLNDEPDLHDWRHPRANWNKPSMALVASDGVGNGCVLFAAGPVVEMALEEWGRSLGDVGLDDAPEGLSVWTGRIAGGERNNYPDGEPYNDMYLLGEFRAPTSDELMRYAFGDGEPWDRSDWLLQEVTK